MEHALITHLLAYGPLAALIGDRLDPNELPQNPTYPAVVYQKISQPRQEMGSQVVRIQYDCYSKLYGESKQVAEQIENAVTAAQGIAGIHSIYIDNVFDDFNVTKQLHRSVVDVVFYYLRSTEFEK